MNEEAGRAKLVADKEEMEPSESAEGSEKVIMANGDQDHEESREAATGSLEEADRKTEVEAGVVNDAFEDVAAEPSPRKVEDASVDQDGIQPLQARRRSTLSGSVESLLERSGMGGHAEKLESSGYDSMQALSQANKEDLMASGLKRGHASLMVHLIAGRMERLKAEENE